MPVVAVNQRVSRPTATFGYDLGHSN